MRILLHSGVLVSTLFIALFHHAAYGYIPFFIALICTVYSICYRRFARTTATDVTVHHDTLHITMIKRRPYTLHGSVTVHVRHTLSDEHTTISVPFSTRAKKHTVSIALPNTYCGTLHVKGMITYVDALGILSKQMPLRTTEAVIWPSIIPSAMHGSTTRLFEQLGTQGGQREHITPYRPGDSIKHIHWALSAKLQTTVIRQHAFDPTPTQTVALSFNDVTTLAQYDAFMRQCFSIVSSPSCTEVIIWQEGWHTHRVQSDADITTLFASLLRAPLASLYAPTQPENALIVEYEGGVAA